MSGVDLHSPERLLETRRELLAAVAASERIVSQARLGIGNLLGDAQRHIETCQRAVNDLERRAVASEHFSPEHELTRATAELSDAVRMEVDVRTRSSELLATLIRASGEIRSRGNDGAAFLASYHSKLTGARAAYSAGSASTTSGRAASPVRPGVGTEDRQAVVDILRSTVRSGFASPSQESEPLTGEELEALRRYTSDRKLDGWGSRWYEIANALLRGNPRGTPLKALTLDDFEKFESTGTETAGIADAMRGLKKLPRVAGVLHRGIDTTSDERTTLLSGLSLGSTYRDVGFFSGSWQEDVARSYAGRGGMLLHVQTQNARSVEGLSRFGPIEHEAILPPFTEFRVQRIRHESSGLTEVWLEEIAD